MRPFVFSAVSSALVTPFLEGLSESDKKSLEATCSLEPSSVIPSQGKVKSTESVLKRFVTENLVPKGYFDESQEALLRSLFSRWHLDAEIRLVDLLGLEIYSQVEKLCESMKEQESIIDNCAFAILGLYQFLFSQAETSWDEYKVHPQDSTFMPKEEYIKNFRKIVISIQVLVEDKKKSINNTLLSPKSKQGLADSIDISVRQLAATEKLLRTCMNHPKPIVLLFSHSIYCFGGTETFSREPAGNASLMHLQQYARYVSAVCDSGFKLKKIGVYANTKAVTDLLQVSIDKLLKLPQKLHKERERSLSELERQRSSLQLAADGKLDYSTWFLQSTGHKATKTKTHSQFIAYLQQNLAIFTTIGVFWNDLYRLLETQVLSARYPNTYIQRHLLSERFELNMICLMADNAYSVETLTERLVIRAMINKAFAPFAAIFTRYMKERLPNRLDRGIIRKISAAEELPGSFAAVKKGNWLGKAGIDSTMELDSKYIERFSNDINLFQQTLESIALSQLYDELKPILHAEIDLEKLKQYAFEESLIYCRVALILCDAEKLLGQNVLGGEIPAGLANLIELEGLDHYLAKLFPPQSAPIQSIEDAPVIAIIPTSVSAPQSAPIQSIEDAPVIANIPISVSSPQPVAESASSPPPKKTVSSFPSISEEEPVFYFENANVRKVLQKLSKAGFNIRRTTGDHHILKQGNGSGPQVVVPRKSSGELAIGTLKSIERQAQVAIAVSALSSEPLI